MVNRPPARYRSARWLHLLGLLYLAWMGGSRLVLALSERELIEALGAEPGPGYLAAAGALWAAAGIAGAAFLFVPRRWARVAVFGLGLLIALSYWADRLVFIPEQANWPFALFLTLVALMFSASLMVLFDQWEAQYGRQ